MDLRASDRKVAYFSMEIGFDAAIPTYSGGLGILAGDTLKSCADLGVPSVAVTLLSEKGYFKQVLDTKGNQSEQSEEWDKTSLLEPLPEKVVVQISGRDVVVQGWIYTLKGNSGFEIPVILLDTNVPENTDYDKTITQHLYQGDHGHRIAQEIVLGVGGAKLLTDLGYNNIHRYHLNEGHSSFLILELLSDTKIHHGEGSIEKRYDFEDIKEKIVFTTHTPVPAGHDQFDLEQVKSIIGNNVETELLERFLYNGKVNMTHVALEMSNYVNGVAKKHAEISRKMFPNHLIHSITNGVHTATWTSPHLTSLFDKYLDDWTLNPSSLRFSMLIPDEELEKAHREAKEELISFVNATTQSNLSPEIFTIGFARRAAKYKRMDLLFSNLDWLKSINDNVGKIQIILAGKAHPQDGGGKDIIKHVFSLIEKLKGKIEVTYVPNYDMSLAKKMIAGVDLWVNTPLKPNEASGTSGMKAAINGVPQLSVLDGWWIEGCLENVTGWGIGTLKESSDEDDARDMYTKLEKFIVPTFYDNKEIWLRIMKQCIALNGSYFNTHRMVREYVLHAYFK